MFTHPTRVVRLGNARTFRHVVGLIVLLCFYSAPAWADIFEDAAGLGRGINMGNALDSPVEGDWGFVIEDEHFRLIRAAGFDSVRIPISWSTHTDEQPDDQGVYAISDTFFERIDTVLEQAKSHGLKVVLDVHHYHELNEKPTSKHRTRFLSIWQQIAERYKNQPRSVFFELFNEPNDGDGNQLDSQTWNPLMLEALSVVRKSNPDRAVIVGGSHWNSVEQLLEISLPENDRNLIGTFHYYSPFPFTHQGASWDPSTPAEGSHHWAGTAEQRQAIEDDFRLANKWSDENKRPVYLGEFGAYSGDNNLNPVEDRARWTATVRQQAESLGIPWAYWEFGSGFGAYDRATGSWIQPVITALIPAEEKQK